MSTLATLFFWLMSSFGVKPPIAVREAAPPSAQTVSESSSDGAAVADWFESAVSPQISNGF